MSLRIVLLKQSKWKSGEQIFLVNSRKSYLYIFDKLNFHSPITMKTDMQHLEKINDLFLLFKEEVERTTMKPLSKKIYIEHAQNFVRWASGDFVPGGKIKTS